MQEYYRTYLRSDSPMSLEAEEELFELQLTTTPARTFSSELCSNECAGFSVRRQDFQRTQQERQRKKSPSGRRFTKKLALYGRQLRGFRLCSSFSTPSPFATVPPQRSLGFLTLVPVTHTLVGGRWVHDIGSCHRPFSFHLISFPWLMPTWHFHSGIWWVSTNVRLPCGNVVIIYLKAHSGHNIIRIHNNVLIL
jgi:hypothetical protein